MPRPGDGPGIPQATGHIVGAPPTEEPDAGIVTPEMASAQSFIPPIQDQQGSGEQDVIRWGDSQTLSTEGTSVAGQAVTEGQLVRVNRLFAETWSIFLYANILPPLNPALPTKYNWTVTFAITVGVGSANVTFEQIFDFDPTQPADIENYGLILSTTNTQIYRTLEIPAKDIQIIALATNNNIGPAGTGSIQVAAFAAPRVLQPSAMQLPPAPGDASSGGGQKTEWMPPGFYPEPVHYR